MRHTRRHSSFFLCFIINLLMNIEWILPFVIFTVLAVLFRHPVLVWLAVISLVLYVGVVGIWTAVLCHISRTTSLPRQRENKNPYSNKVQDPYGK